MLGEVQWSYMMPYAKTDIPSLTYIYIFFLFPVKSFYYPFQKKKILTVKNKLENVISSQCSWWSSAAKAIRRQQRTCFYWMESHLSRVNIWNLIKLDFSVLWLWTNNLFVVFHPCKCKNSRGWVSNKTCIYICQKIEITLRQCWIL